MRPLFVVVPDGTTTTFSFYGLSQARDLAARLARAYQVTLYRRVGSGELQVMEQLAPPRSA